MVQEKREHSTYLLRDPRVAYRLSSASTLAWTVQYKTRLALGSVASRSFLRRVSVNPSTHRPLSHFLGFGIGIPCRPRPIVPGSVSWIRPTQVAAGVIRPQCQPQETERRLNKYHLILRACHDDFSCRPYLKFDEFGDGFLNFLLEDQFRIETMAHNSMSSPQHSFETNGRRLNKSTHPPPPSLGGDAVSTAVVTDLLIFVARCPDIRCC